jgi:hypothetical protein
VKRVGLVANSLESVNDAGGAVRKDEEDGKKHTSDDDDAEQPE